MKENVGKRKERKNKNFSTFPKLYTCVVLVCQGKGFRKCFLVFVFLRRFLSETAELFMIMDEEIAIKLF